MKKLIGLTILLGFWGLLGARPALAISLDFIPRPSVPEVLAVDIVISGTVGGAPPSVGAFDLDVTFDPDILSPISVTFGLHLGDPALFEALIDFNFLPGVVDLAAVSLLSPARLDALQPDSFPLATLVFGRLGPGEGRLTFSQIIVDDAFGNKLIPEPGTLVLLGCGLAALAVSRKQRRG